MGRDPFRLPIIPPSEVCRSFAQPSMTAGGTPSQGQAMVHESPGEPRRAARNRFSRILQVWLRKSLAIVRPTRKNQHDSTLSHHMRFEVRTATESAGNLCTWAWAL